VEDSTVMPADRLAARKAVALLAVVVLMVVAAFTLGSSAAVADTGSLPGTGVAAFDLADGDAVGPAVAIGPGEGRETVDSCSTSALGVVLPQERQAAVVVRRGCTGWRARGTRG
jgi:hypothetical protein